MSTHIAHMNNGWDFIDGISSDSWLSLKCESDATLSITNENLNPINITTTSPNFQLNKKTTISETESEITLNTTNTMGLGTAILNFKDRNTKKWSIRWSQMVPEFVIYNETTGKTPISIDIITDRVGINNNLIPLHTIDINGDCNISNGESYKINSVMVINQTDLGPTIVNSSIQNLGPQNANLNMNSNSINNISNINFTGDITSDTLKVDNTNNEIGINTNTPLAELHLNKELHLSSNNTSWNLTAGKGLYLRYSTNGGQDSGYIQSINRSTVTKYPLTINSSLLTIDSDLNLSTNNITNTGSITTIGTIQCGGVLTALNTINAESVITPLTAYLKDVDPVSTISRFKSDNATVNSTKMEIRANGDIYHAGGIFALSDRRFKENITNAPTQWDEIKQLTVCNYNWKEAPEKTEIGLIAQESIWSEISQQITIDDKEVYVVRMDRLEYKMLKVIQELQHRIETLESLDITNTYPTLLQQHNHIIVDVNSLNQSLIRVGLL